MIIERKEFNPKEWLVNEKVVTKGSVGEAKDVGFGVNDVEAVIERIEAEGKDITADYEVWRNIGFALASEFGEGGREYFHRVSCFHPGYERRACDQQFDYCLKSKGSGITIKSLFYYAKEAGVVSSKVHEFTSSQVEGSAVRQFGGSAVGGEMEDVSPVMPTKEASSQGVFLEGGAVGSLVPRDDRGEREDNGKVRGMGVEVRGEKDDGGKMTDDREEQRAPTLPVGIYEGLPQFLKKVVVHAASEEERDLLLLGSVGALSACFPKVYGIYDGKKVFSNLYLFITAKASAGKGRLVHCKQLVMPIHMHLREQAKLLKKEYEVQLLEYNQVKGENEKGEKPGKPAEKMLLIPANNSTTGVFQLLHDNEGRGLIFETEGDTLAQAFKSDYGNYSDGFRKAFHHETISYYRRTDREYVDMEHPCVSTVLSGTPRQVSALIPSAENGLFSRFIFYYMNVQPVWKDVFRYSGDESLDSYYGRLGLEFFRLYQHLEEQGEIEFRLTEEQQGRFNEFFEQVQGVYVSLKGLDYLATVRRLGLIAFRMCMVFTGLRVMEHGVVNSSSVRRFGSSAVEVKGLVVCEDGDFETVLEICRVLVKHAAKVFSELPEEVQLLSRKNRKEVFYEGLPKEFGRKIYQEVARQAGISDKSAQRYLAEFCRTGLVSHDEHGKYEKLLFEELRN